MVKELVTLDINQIIPYENNPRNNAKAIKPVADSIKEVGYNTVIVVDEDNIILAGHTRFSALKSLGIKEIEVLKVSGLTEEQKKKYRLYDNKTNELASWDYVALLDEVSQIDEFEPIGIDWGLESKDDFDTEYSNKEIGSEEFEDERFKYECPHCGFMFNDN